MTDFTIDELQIPATLEATGGDDFAAAVELGNTVEAIGYGTAELAFSPAETLTYWQDPHQPHRMLVARSEGRIVGVGEYETRVGEDADSAWLVVKVPPEYRRRGIGTALADALEQLVRADGKPKALVYAVSRDVPGERLVAPTGFGSVPLAGDEVRFLLARGYRLEQVERGSRLALPVAGLDGLLAGAAAASGRDYAVHTWAGGTPPRWREDLAVLLTRMSTDAPTAGLEEEEDFWTVERLIEADERHRDNPRTDLCAAVEHLPSGRLVGFSELSVPPELSRAVHQESTLVLSEFRGHRLGMLLKLANLAHLERVRPGHPAIVTWNAEENRHMLSVNEAVGFVPIGYEGAWKKILS